MGEADGGAADQGQAAACGGRLERPRAGVGLLWLDRPARANALDQAHFERLRDDLLELSFLDLRVLVLAGRGAATSAAASTCRRGTRPWSRRSRRSRTRSGRGPWSASSRAASPPCGPCPWSPSRRSRAPASARASSWPCTATCGWARRAAATACPRPAWASCPIWAGAPCCGAFWGPGPAAYLGLSGRPIDADEAHRLGLLSERCAEGEALSAALRLADDVLLGSPTATGACCACCATATPRPPPRPCTRRPRPASRRSARGSSSRPPWPEWSSARRPGPRADGGGAPRRRRGLVAAGRGLAAARPPAAPRWAAARGLCAAPRHDGRSGPDDAPGRGPGRGGLPRPGRRQPRARPERPPAARRRLEL
jgi:hypothetical protein